MHKLGSPSPPHPSLPCTLRDPRYPLVASWGPPLYFVPLSCWRLSKKCAQKQESRQQREDTNADMTSSSKDVMAAVAKVHGHEQPEEHWGQMAPAIAQYVGAVCRASHLCMECTLMILLILLVPVNLIFSALWQHPAQQEQEQEQQQQQPRQAPG